MKIPDLDRRRAIKRLPEFKIACERRERTERENLPKFLSEFMEKWGYEFEAILYADEVAEHRKDTPAAEAVCHISDMPIGIVYQGEGKENPILVGDSLYLKVNPYGITETQLREDCWQASKSYVEKANENVPKERSRKTDIPGGIWPVYDLYVKTGENLNETTRQWFGLSGSPIHDWDEKYLKRIKTATSRAQSIIAEVRKGYRL